MANQAKIKVLMVAAEVAPFAKVGGLADVVGSLPQALHQGNCQIKVIMPKYGSIEEQKFKLKKFKSRIKIISGNKTFLVNLWKTQMPGSQVEIFFLEHQKHFGKADVYWANNSERFLFFSLACLESLPYLDFEPDIIHCHDFHTAMIPDLIKANPELWGHLKTLYTIHNLNYQGKSEIEVLSTGNLNSDSLTSLSRDAQDGDINFMVQGIINSDKVNTVSPTYAQEITTSVYGSGLDKVIKANQAKITGILNGLDTKLFNPKTDVNLVKNYDFCTLSRKDINKLALQKLLNLPTSKTTPLIGVVSRLCWQKGLDLITKDLIKDLPCQLVILGTGDKVYEDKLQHLATTYPEKVKLILKFDLKLAMQIYAGSDMFLMPSRFEPCGLGQMIAMRYGSVPVVRATGGLADTVNRQNGFSFKDLETKVLKQTLEQAIKVYTNNPKKWHTLQKQGMTTDFTWKRSATKYLALYRALTGSEK